jgi:hypothetical protein
MREITKFSRRQSLGAAGSSITGGRVMTLQVNAAANPVPRRPLGEPGWKSQYRSRGIISARPAADGRWELFKTTKRYDGPRMS